MITFFIGVQRINLGDGGDFTTRCRSSLEVDPVKISSRGQATLHHTI